MKGFISTFVIMVLLACHPSAPKQSNTESPSDQYSEIVAITEKNGEVFIDADYVQYLTGDSAIEAAKKEHEADTFTINGITHIDVPNDYFILNENTKIRSIKLSGKAVFDLLLDIDRNPLGKMDNSLEGLKKIYKDGLFLLTIKGDEIIKIKEIFLP